VAVVDFAPFLFSVLACPSGEFFGRFDSPKNASTAASAVSMPAFFFMIAFSLANPGIRF
jgi:hypothetical protein